MINQRCRATISKRDDEEVRPTRYEIPSIANHVRSRPRISLRFIRATSLFRLEIHRYAVDAIAQSGRRRAIRKDVAEMAAAAAAMRFSASHAVGTVVRFLDRARFRIVEARPAGAALELLLRLEQLLPAARAGEGAGALLVIERAASRPLGAVLAHDVELLGRQNLAPLGLGVGDGISLHVHRSAPLYRPPM